MTLSDRQKRILSFISQFAAEHGYPPTIREIGAAVTIPSTSVVNYNLNVLQREGYLTRSPDVSRGINVVEPEHEVNRLLPIPILGTIAAGEPVPLPSADFSPFDYETLTLTSDMIKPQEGLYALLVKGVSMIDALINDGDYVVMKHQQEARNGEMVAVRLKAEDTTTLKYFYYEGDRVRLQPANPQMKPIYTHPANVEVQGRVMAVLRQLP
jgi:repressor LexA